MEEEEEEGGGMKVAVAGISIRQIFDKTVTSIRGGKKNTLVLKPIDTGQHTNLRVSQQIFVFNLIL